MAFPDILFREGSARRNKHWVVKVKHYFWARKTTSPDACGILEVLNFGVDHVSVEFIRTFKTFNKLEDACTSQLNAICVETMTVRALLAALLTLQFLGHALAGPSTQDIIQFMLNLQCLKAQYYHCGVTGRCLLVRPP
jgi:hypothetical protein